MLLMRGGWVCSVGAPLSTHDRSAQAASRSLATTAGLCSCRCRNSARTADRTLAEMHAVAMNVPVIITHSTNASSTVGNSRPPARLDANSPDMLPHAHSITTSQYTSQLQSMQG